MRCVKCSRETEKIRNGLCPACYAAGMRYAIKKKMLRSVGVVNGSYMTQKSLVGCVRDCVGRVMTRLFGLKEWVFVNGVGIRNLLKEGVCARIVRIIFEGVFGLGSARVVERMW